MPEHTVHFRQHAHNGCWSGVVCLLCLAQEANACGCGMPCLLEWCHQGAKCCPYPASSADPGMPKARFWSWQCAFTVRGNSPALLQEFGFETHNVEMRIAFGRDGSAWTNHRLILKNLVVSMSPSHLQHGSGLVLSEQVLRRGLADHCLSRASLNA